MITRLVLRNFKSVGEETYEFTDFDLLVGRNNCGKSTVLQAMAIWQFCVDEFHRSKRSGKTGKQVVLPNFTALPVPEFNLLWREKTDRRYPQVDGKRSAAPEYVLIEVALSWRGGEGVGHTFTTALRYMSPQSAFALPLPDWKAFREAEKTPAFPRIAYVPPFSGLEPTEEWRDDGPIRRQVGKAQPGSVLRNLLYRVYPSAAKDGSEGTDADQQARQNAWRELTEAIRNWFSVELLPPKYERGVDTQILCEYKQGGKTYDIIAGGSGFHQALTLLAFLYGYRPTTLLLDEPDAHMHVSLQRAVLDFFQAKCRERGIQFIVATHAEELVKGVDTTRILSVLSQRPTRLVDSRDGVLSAMADVSNAELAQLAASPAIVYVEGETDERILRAWAETCGAGSPISAVCFHHMGGGNKQQMKEAADRHFEGVRQVISGVRRLLLFDRDMHAGAFHPGPGNPVLCEWRRRNIENYLLVAPAWVRAAGRLLGLPENDLLLQPVRALIEGFFQDENLTLPRGQEWRNLTARVFVDVDGKRLLFEESESLFARLRQCGTPVSAIREAVAGSMTAEEIHEDVHAFFSRLRSVVPTAGDAEGQSQARG
jgi:ABC-type taurine transport system ATPase subunit